MALNMKTLLRQSQARSAKIVALKNQGWTLREIGERFDISHQRAAQILKAAAKKAKP